MGRKEILFTAALSSLLLAGAADAPASIQQSKKGPARVRGWVSDIPTGFRLAQQSGRPIMIVFR